MHNPKNTKMKTTLKMKIGIIALALFAILATIPSASAETITTTCGSTTTTRINGYLELKGNSSASVWFDWGATTALGSSTTRQTFTQDSNFSQPIYGLTPGKTYYYRAMGTSDAGPAQGEIKTFKVICEGDENTNSNKPTVDISADDTSIDYDDNTIVRWSSTNADTCTASGGTNGWSGSRNKSGSFNTGDLTRDVTYTIRCENEDGSAIDSVAVRVEDADNDNDRPTVTIWANPVSVVQGSSSIVSWSSNNADTCRGTGGTSGWNGSRARSGSFNTSALYGSVTFSIRCENDNGSVTDSVSIGVYSKPVVVKPPVYVPPKYTPPAPRGNPLIIVNSSVDRHQPIVPTLDNTNPCPGDEINYTVTYQNVGTAGVTNLVLRVDLPYEVDYMYSTPNNPTRSGQTLIFNLGTLRAGGQGTVSIRVHVRENARNGAPLNFPATLSYVDNTGYPQSVSANVSANVCPLPLVVVDSEAERAGLSASVFGVGFLPENIFGWLLLIILILILILLLRHLFGLSPLRSERTLHNTYGAPYSQPVQPMHNYGNPPSNLPGTPMH